MSKEVAENAPAVEGEVTENVNAPADTANAPAADAPKKPVQAKAKKSTYKVANPFFYGDGEKRVKFEIGDTLPEFSQPETERYLSLGIIEEA